ncbi:MAG: hypothetical protein QXT26_04665 [Thermoproteota archaeon]
MSERTEANNSRQLRTFSEWKTLTIQRLIQLYDSTENPKTKNDIIAIIDRLHYARLRDLSTVLSYIFSASKNVPDLRKIIPSEEEIEAWWKDSGKRKI